MLSRRRICGKSYLVTHRTYEGRAFLTPSERTVRAIQLVILARAAHLTGVRVHAFQFLITHYHLLVTDPYGLLGLFMQYLNALLARAMNAELNHSRAFWQDKPYNAIELTDAESFLHRYAYVVGNCVKDGLVRRSHTDRQQLSQRLS